MIIGIWGMGGTGKSTIATSLGHIMSAKGITVVIDSDVTKPTIPSKLPGKEYPVKKSLGHIFSTQYVRDAKMFMFQHPKAETLFFAGTDQTDTYLTNEISMKKLPQARDFIRACGEIADNVIIDISTQKEDPFFAAASELADIFLIVLPPDLSGVCFHRAIQDLLTKIRGIEGKPIHYVASPTHRHHSIPTFEKTTGAKFEIVLPYVKTIGFIQSKGELIVGNTGSGVKRWSKQLQLYLKKITAAAQAAEVERVVTKVEQSTAVSN